MAADFCRPLISFPIEEVDEDEDVVERLEPAVPAELATLAVFAAMALAACIMFMFLLKEAFDSALPSSDHGTC